MRYLLALPLALALLAGRAAGQDVPPVSEGVDVQARGVIHEAFGDPGAVQNAPGPVITQTPPRLIDEVPPEDKPAGDGVVWVSGYWNWDEEAKDFVWVSGFWRTPPPGRSWMPGHWQNVSGGYQYVSGYWNEPTASEVEYLPTPPESIERGPTVAAPEGQYNYVPGMWVWRTGRYLWRPGYYLAYRPGWVWVCGCYRWTPCGFVYVPGHWDLPLLERGVLFAPVRLSPVVYLRPGFVYRPAYVIQPDFLMGAMFVRPGRPYYYFGDYFAASYRPVYTPWVAYRPYRTVVDLNFGYYRFSFAKYDGWERGMTGLYAARYAGDVPRPPRTLSAQTTVIRDYTTGGRLRTPVSRSINLTHADAVTALRPLNRTTTISATGLTTLSGPRPTGVTPVVREIRLERVSRERLAEERRSIERDRALATHRTTTTATMLKTTPATGLTAPVKVKVDLPKTVPPARVVKPTTKPPVAPVRPTPSEVKLPVVKTPVKPPVVKDPVKPPVVKDPVKPPVVKDPPPVIKTPAKDPPPVIKTPPAKDPTPMPKPPTKESPPKKDKK